MQFRFSRSATGTTLQPPVSLAVLTIALTASVIAIGTYLGTQSYARKATAPGYLAPLHGVVRVLPPRAGVIASVEVADGDFVHAGDPLLRVAVGRRSLGGMDIDETVHHALIAQRDLQQQQLKQEESTAQSEQLRLGERIGRLQEECQSLAMQQAVQHDRANLAQEQAAVSRDLATKGYVSAVEQRRREDARLGQAQALDTLRQQLAAKQGELVELRYALAQLPGRTADRVATLRAAIAELDSRVAEAEAQRAYLVVAPAAGRVSALQASAGNPADPTQPLLSIVPQGEALQAILFVPERAIGFVAPGQPVRLSLDAFPFQRFGAQNGTVSSVARTLLRPEQLSAAVQPPREPSYRVTVALQGQHLTAYGRDIPLQADMQLSANIIFDRRSFIEWLLDPVISARGRS
jgi:membrane fusion protein